jgi:hypothetical protein
MAEVYRAYPNDLDVRALYAESLMLLNTERAFYRTSDPFVRAPQGLRASWPRISTTWARATYYIRRKLPRWPYKARGLRTAL